MKPSRLRVPAPYRGALVFTAASIGALIVAVHFHWFTEKQVVLIAGCTFTALQVLLKVQAKRQGNGRTKR